MKKGLIQATDAFERIVHWSLALSCLLLCITGLGMMFHSFNFIGDHHGRLESPEICPQLYGPVLRRFRCFTIRMWWKEAGVFSLPEDLEWIKVAGGYLWHVDKVPGGGQVQPRPEDVLPDRGGLRRDHGRDGADHVVSVQPSGGAGAVDVYPLHALGFVVIFAFFFVHLYLGTIGSPGSLPAMLHGWVTRAG